MDPFVNILVFLHFVALAFGVGGGAALGMIGPAMAKAEPAGRVALGGVRRRVFDTVTIALVILIVSGPLILWLRYGGIDIFVANYWFWAKMLLVALLIVMNIWSRRLLKRAEGGDMSVIPVMARNGQISGITSLLIVLCAVFAFN